MSAATASGSRLVFSLSAMLGATERGGVRNMAACGCSAVTHDNSATDSTNMPMAWFCIIDCRGTNLCDLPTANLMKPSTDLLVNSLIWYTVPQRPTPMREIITLSIGPFSNWVGSHFWNVQDDARHPVSYDDSGEPVYDDRQADVALLYRSAGRGSQLTPRLVLCDAVDSFGSLNSEDPGARLRCTRAPHRSTHSHGAAQCRRWLRSLAQPTHLCR